MADFSTYLFANLGNGYKVVNISNFVYYGKTQLTERITYSVARIVQQAWRSKVTKGSAGFQAIYYLKTNIYNKSQREQQFISGSKSYLIELNPVFAQNFRNFYI